MADDKHKKHEKQEQDEATKRAQMALVTKLALSPLSMFLPFSRDLLNQAIDHVVGKSPLEAAEEAERRESAARITRAEAQAAQDVALAVRIQSANVVEIEESYEHASEGAVGLQADANAGTLNLGVQGSRRRLTSRKIVLKGWPGDATPPADATGTGADGAAGTAEPK